MPPQRTARHRETAICTHCVGVFRRNNPRQWNTERDMCRLCGIEEAEREAHRRARATTGLTIRIRPQKPCELCKDRFPLAHFRAEEGNENPYKRCHSCRKAERCTKCHKIKKRKNFKKGQTDELYKTCTTCRTKSLEQTARKRAEAQDAGERWCTPGGHRVSITACTAEDGTIRAACRDCLAEQRARYAAAVAAAQDEQHAQDETENSLGDDHAEGFEAAAMDEYDEIFGDGQDLMDVDLPEDSALTDREAKLLQTMNEKLDALRIETCTTCMEEGFNMNLQVGICSRCRNDKGEPVRKWSNENNANPGSSLPAVFVAALLIVLLALEVPSCLKGLTDMEDMLIARVKSYMQVRWTKGRQLCYQDHIVNFRQDITEVANRLPRLPEETDIVIIRREDVDLNRHVDFIVRREKVATALRYKKQHDPDYADLQIDEDILMQLPINGSVADRIPTCLEGRQDGHNQVPAMPAGPVQAAGEGEVTEHDNIDEQFVGGVLNLGVQGHVEVDEIRDGANNVVQGLHYEQHIVSREHQTHEY